MGESDKTKYLFVKRKYKLDTDRLLSQQGLFGGIDRNSEEITS